MVSRRVDEPTRAEPGDEAVYQAADPVPDGSAAAEPGAGNASGPGDTDGSGTTDRAARELSDTATSEPTRSE